MRFRPSFGPDPAFPYLDETRRYRFPDPLKGKGDIIALGGNLSPGMLLSAYEQGLFPWYNPEDPILWQSPDPRFVLFPEKLHISRSMAKVLKKGVFTVRFDHNFPGVIRSCAAADRSGKNDPEPPGTWITADMIAGYTTLHRLGFAHSAESYAADGELAGGCYGIRLGNVFFGESMFTRQSNASKAAFLTLAHLLFNDGVQFIDCQAHTDHLESLGAQEISRPRFLALLGEALAGRNSAPSPDIADALDRRGDWGQKAPLSKNQ
ncbi:MAG: leucyl/phenylalanyl-tRNA--protein transferase [Treponema sp.]|jgi:leucyl/phenylalanyl-tRNA--protein transferase|nr:leucyl/phenylalanyl-tRNA--protein transferase [Treponema sp.]